MQTRLIQLPVLLAALLLLYEAGLSLRFDLADHVLQLKLKNSNFETLNTSERLSNLQMLQEVAGLKRATAESHYAVAEYAWKILRSSKDLNAQTPELVCTIFQELARAESLEPLNYWYLIKQAERKIYLSAHSCSATQEQRSVPELVNRAVSLAPRDPTLLFLAAQILFRDPDFEKQAADFLRQYLNLPINIETEKLLYIFSKLKSDEDVYRIVPVRLARVASLAAELRSRRPFQHQLLNQAFAKLEQQALETLPESFSNSEQLIRTQEMLITLLRADPISSIRQQVDRKLAELFERSSKGQLAEYLRMRSDLAELDVVKGFHRRDSRPEKLAASRWGSSQEVRLDSAKSSLVFFLGLDQQAKLIELRSLSGIPTGFLSGIEVYASQDNREWRRINVEHPKSPGELGAIHLLAITIDHANFRYWKVHFAGITDQIQVSNILSDIIHIYGLKKGTGGVS